MNIYRGIKLADNVKLYNKGGSYNNKIKNNLDGLVNKLSENGHELLSEYVSSQDKALIDFKCGHDPHWIIPNAYKNGNGCPKCTGHCPEHAKEEFLNMLEINGHQILGEYVDAKTKILIDYNCGHTPHLISPNHYKKGVRCPKCSGNDVEQAIEGLIKLLKSNGHTWIDGEYVKSSTKILIDFRCGHEPHWITPSHYKNGRVCPFCKESKGEKRIRQLLEKNKIDFDSQKEFEGLIGLRGRNLSYDFYLPKLNILIEYQGLQHEKYVKGFHKDQNAFKKQQEHDVRKRQYAKLHDIELLEIWYWEYDNINSILNKLINNDYV